MDTNTDRAAAVIDTTATEVWAEGFLPNEDGDPVDVRLPDEMELKRKPHFSITQHYYDVDASDVQVVAHGDTSAWVRLGRALSVFPVDRQEDNAKQALTIIRSIGNAIVDQASDLLDQITDAECEAAMAHADDAEFAADLNDRSVA